MKDLIRQLLTGKDGLTHDMGRWSWLLSMATVIGHSIYAAVQHTAVDVMQLAQALGVVVAAHGAALWAKASTEPEAK